MKKQWMKRLAVFSFVVAVGTGYGTTLWAQQEENSSVQEDQSVPDVEEAAPKEDEEEPSEEEVSETETEGQAVNSTERPSSDKPVKKTAQPKALAENGQTLLDISKGDIRITTNGATGGGLSADETSLNPKGYWITGTTTDYNVIVEENVKTDLTLDHVNITRGIGLEERADCINVSHADVTITLIGNNQLLCNSGGEDNERTHGMALAKDGMDGSLTIQCEHVNEKGHKCDDQCGTLIAKGNESLLHAGAIGSTARNRAVPKDSGFANFTIKGGNIEASGGTHSPGIGSSCVSESKGGGYTKNIRISGGNVKATGTECGSGIGSGYGNTVEGIYITGGVVEARGGENAPGIGASKCLKVEYYPEETMLTKDVCISGGDTIVVAIGDQDTDMPGIGSGGGSDKVSNVKISPDFGYQGYIQDGTSLEDYTFTDGTPFKEEGDISVEKFYTKVYFGPFRDQNEIKKDTKEQIGANHVISKTGGDAFTEEQLKGLAKVTGKQQDGTDFPITDLTFFDKKQVEKINKAKAEGELGEFELTFSTPNKTKITVKVYLKAGGTDAAEINPERMEPTIGANNFAEDTGGNAFTEDEVRSRSSVQGKDADGTTYEAGELIPDAGELTKINEAKTAGKAGKFPLTFTSPDGKKAKVSVTLYFYDETAKDEASGETLKASHVISKTGGTAFTEEQLKKISMVKGTAGDGTELSLDQITYPMPQQLNAINQAKTAGETGEYPLTFTTPDGTKVEVKVYLTSQGKDEVAWEEGSSSLGANDVVYPTGGNKFSREELIELCQAKGKNGYGGAEELEIGNGQLERLNQAKEAGKTGVFEVTFALKDGTKTSVKVTLTGEHKVSFDPNGGDYQPEDQTIAGGEPAVEPKEPKKEGYVFEGWYFKNADGNESLWDFDTPVNESMTLKAKWKKDSKDAAKSSDTKDIQKQKGKQGGWKYKEVQKTRNQEQDVAKTGEQSHLPWILGCLAGAFGIGICIFVWKRK